MLPPDTVASDTDGQGPAVPYPSDIAVSGVPAGEITSITVTLNDLNHTFPDDLDVLLVAPSGERTLLMSDAGLGGDAVNLDLTFDDAATGGLPDGNGLATGTFKPTNFGTGDAFLSPAPPSPYGDPQGLSRFFDDDPNGTWSLYVVDDAAVDTGNVNGGWTLTIEVDEPPVAQTDTPTVEEDAGPTTIDVLANDTDADGGPKRVVSVTGAEHGTVGITSGGAAVSYDPDPDYCNDPGPEPTDDFTYTLNGGSAASVAVTVTCREESPVAVADSATIDEDAGATGIDVLANDTDADGGARTISSVTNPAHGTVTLTGGSPGAHTGLTYQPDPNYCNEPGDQPTDDFTYTVNGGSTATVSVTVTCHDEPQPQPQPQPQQPVSQRLSLGRAVLSKRTGAVVIPVTCTASHSGPCSTDLTMSFRRRGLRPVTRRAVSIPVGTTVKVALSARRSQRNRMRRIARLPARFSATNPPGAPVVASAVLRGQPPKKKR